MSLSASVFELNFETFLAFEQSYWNDTDPEHSCVIYMHTCAFSFLFTQISPTPNTPFLHIFPRLFSVLSLPLPTLVWGCLICKCLAGYCAVFIVCSAPCCRIEEPHLETGLLCTLPAFLCIGDARSGMSQTKVLYMCASLCVFEHLPLSYPRSYKKEFWDKGGNSWCFYKHREIPSCSFSPWDANNIFIFLAWDPSSWKRIVCFYYSGTLLK